MLVVGRSVDAELLLKRTLELADTLGHARLQAYALLGWDGR